MGIKLKVLKINPKLLGCYPFETPVVLAITAVLIFIQTG